MVEFEDGSREEREAEAVLDTYENIRLFLGNGRLQNLTYALDTFDKELDLKFNDLDKRLFGNTLSKLVSQEIGMRGFFVYSGLSTHIPKKYFESFRSKEINYRCVIHFLEYVGLRTGCTNEYLEATRRHVDIMIDRFDK